MITQSRILVPVAVNQDNVYTNIQLSIVTGENLKRITVGRWWRWRMGRGGGYALFFLDLVPLLSSLRLLLVQLLHSLSILFTSSRLTILPSFIHPTIASAPKIYRFWFTTTSSGDITYNDPLDFLGNQYRFDTILGLNPTILRVSTRKVGLDSIDKTEHL